MTAFRGDAATVASKYERARRLYPLEGVLCERCSAPAEERHHKDRDPGNNARSNVELLCRSCHRAEHPEVSAAGGRALKGRKLTPEHREKIAAGVRARGPVSDETRAKLSANKSAYYANKAAHQLPERK